MILFGYDLVKKKKKRDPTRFSKKIMIVSIMFITAYVVGCFILSWHVNSPLDSTLHTCVFAYFSAEAMANAWIRVSELKSLKEEKKNELVN